MARACEREWSGQMAVTLQSIFSSLAIWKINRRTWLNEYFAARAESQGVPMNPEPFLPWNLSKKRLAEFQRADEGQEADRSWQAICHSAFCDPSTPATI